MPVVGRSLQTNWSLVLCHRRHDDAADASSILSDSAVMLVGDD